MQEKRTQSSARVAQEQRMRCATNEQCNNSTAQEQHSSSRQSKRRPAHKSWHAAIGNAAVRLQRKRNARVAREQCNARAVAKQEQRSSSAVQLTSEVNSSSAIKQQLQATTRSNNQEAATAATAATSTEQRSAAHKQQQQHQQQQQRSSSEDQLTSTGKARTARISAAWQYSSELNSSSDNNYCSNCKHHAAAKQQQMQRQQRHSNSSDINSSSSAVQLTSKLQTTQQQRNNDRQIGYQSSEHSSVSIEFKKSSRLQTTQQQKNNDRQIGYQSSESKWSVPIYFNPLRTRVIHGITQQYESETTWTWKSQKSANLLNINVCTHTSSRTVKLAILNKHRDLRSRFHHWLTSTDQQPTLENLRCSQSFKASLRIFEERIIIEEFISIWQQCEPQQQLASFNLSRIQILGYSFNWHPTEQSIWEHI